MKPLGSFALQGDYMQATPDEGWCYACDKQAFPVVFMKFDITISITFISESSIHEVSLSVCKKCLQQIIDVCFDSEGYLP